MDGFTGFKTATAEELPDAVAVMDPFHVGAPGRGRLGRVPPPGPAGHSTATGAARATRSTRARRTLHTGADLLTDKQTTGSTACSPPTRTSRSKRPGGSTSA